MKCPKCGNELRESKKTPGYFLCDSCKKKFSQETLERFRASRALKKKAAEKQAAEKTAPESHTVQQPEKPETERAAVLTEPVSEQTRQTDVLTENASEQNEQTDLLTETDSEQSGQTDLLTENASEQNEQTDLLTETDSEQSEQTDLLTETDSEQSEQTDLLTETDSEQSEQTDMWPEPDSEQNDEPVYSNIPPEDVRIKREAEMKANYEALLNIKDEEKNTDAADFPDDASGSASDGTGDSQSAWSDTPDDDPEYDDDMEYDEPACRGFRILVGLLSIAGAAFLGYQAFSSGILSTFLHTHELTGTAGMLLAVCMLIGGIVVLCTQTRNSAAAFLVPAVFFIAGACGSALLPGSVLTVKICIYVSAVFGALMLFFLCRAKYLHMALSIIVLIIALAAAGGGCFAIQKYFVKESLSLGKSLRLDTESFTAVYEKYDIKEDYDGEESLLVYYTLTNKGSDTIVPSVAVTFKAIQDNTTLESTIVPDEKLTDNETVEVKKGDSVRVCTSFRLLDKSDVTLQLYESFGSGGKSSETTLSLK